jgi:hypothetical protein
MFRKKLAVQSLDNVFYAVFLDDKRQVNARRAVRNERNIYVLNRRKNL